MTPNRSSVDETPVEIVSEALRYPSRSGLKIAAYWDHMKKGFEGRPFVVMAPKFGETKKNNLQLAYLLAANGLNVVRFDHTCHVGESAGVKTAFTLPGAVDDILATLDFVEQRFSQASVSLVASSLSARTAVRAAAIDARISLLLCLVGVVNVRYTLIQVYREDIFGSYLSGKPWGVTDILGHEVEGNRFIGSAVEADLHDLGGCERDMARIDAPVIFLNGDEDSWVKFDEVQQAVGRARQGRVLCVPGVKHEVRENPKASEAVFRDVVQDVVRHVSGRLGRAERLYAPEQRALLAQNRIERNLLREALPQTGEESDFWANYLGKYALLGRVAEYGEYLDLLGSVIQPFEAGHHVLDAGCGNGLFGAWLLRKIQRQNPSDVSVVYVGLDLTDRGLGDAMSEHSRLIVKEQHRAAGAKGHQVSVVFARADFDQLCGNEAAGAIPRFEAGSFDSINCSLVLSYLKDPSALLREFRRLLRRDGRLVVSSMKPYCDLSSIYRDFMDEGVSQSDLDSARNLLRAAGSIKLKEEQGYYVFFSAKELVELVEAAGFRSTQVFSSFGDQAVVVSAVA